MNKCKEMVEKFNQVVPSNFHVFLVNLHMECQGLDPGELIGSFGQRQARRAAGAERGYGS